MAKIVSLVVFVLALSWTWFQFKKTDPVSVDVHAGVQAKLQLLIEETIKSKIPTMQEFRFLKMITEKIDETQLKASFSYEYQDPTDQTKQMVSGDAYLTRALSEDPTIKKWILQRVVTGQETIEFAEGLVITPEAETNPAGEAPGAGDGSGNTPEGAGATGAPPNSNTTDNSAPTSPVGNPGAGSSTNLNNAKPDATK